MAKQSGKIARNYARALFEAANPDQLEMLRGALLSLSDIWETNGELQGALLNPSTSSAERFDVMRGLAEAVLSSEDSGCGAALSNLLCLLAKNERLECIPELARLFTRLVDHYNKLLTLEITSAFPLPEDEKQNICARLQAELGSNANVSWKVDPQILGGLVIKCGDRLLDSSVSGSLQKLRGQLTQ